ncbi:MULTISPECIES: hypothetical protein [unclassified Nocardioides]|uniref:hypothetical protein n=1 Tax=unclassified Nocardioides TaxID=2615069 RepID=UPI00360653AB
MTNDLGSILLILFGTLGGIAGLLFLLAAIDPQNQPRAAQPVPGDGDELGDPLRPAA